MGSWRPGSSAELSSATLWTGCALRALLTIRLRWCLTPPAPKPSPSIVSVHQEVEHSREGQRGLGVPVGASPSATVTGGHASNSRRVEGADTTRRAWTWRSLKTAAETAAVWTWATSVWDGGLGYV